jgi:hypothetical protein
VADDFAVEINIGLGDSGDVAKISGYGWHNGESVGAGGWEIKAKIAYWLSVS